MKKMIELRSEKVRSIIGENPPMVIRWGTMTVTIIVICAIILFLCLPYSETVVIKGEMREKTDYTEVAIMATPTLTDRLKKGTIVTLTLGGNKDIRKGKILSILKKNVNKSGSCLLFVRIWLDSKMASSSRESVDITFLLCKKKMWKYFIRN